MPEVGGLGVWLPIFVKKTTHFRDNMPWTSRAHVYLIFDREKPKQGVLFKSWILENLPCLALVRRYHPELCIQNPPVLKGHQNPPFNARILGDRWSQCMDVGGFSSDVNIAESNGLSFFCPLAMHSWENKKTCRNRFIKKSKRSMIQQNHRR